MPRAGRTLERWDLDVKRHEQRCRRPDSCVRYRRRRSRATDSVGTCARSPRRSTRASSQQHYDDEVFVDWCRRALPSSNVQSDLPGARTRRVRASSSAASRTHWRGWGLSYVSGAAHVLAHQRARLRRRLMIPRPDGVGWPASPSGTKPVTRGWGSSGRFVGRVSTYRSAGAVYSLRIGMERHSSSESPRLKVRDRQQPAPGDTASATGAGGAWRHRGGACPGPRESGTLSDRSGPAGRATRVGSARPGPARLAHYVTSGPARTCG